MLIPLGVRVKRAQSAVRAGSLVELVETPPDDLPAVRVQRAPQVREQRLHLWFHERGHGVLQSRLVLHQGHAHSPPHQFTFGFL